MRDGLPEKERYLATHIGATTRGTRDRPGDLMACQLQREDATKTAHAPFSGSTTMTPSALQW